MKGRNNMNEQKQQAEQQQAVQQQVQDQPCYVHITSVIEDTLGGSRGATATVVSGLRIVVHRFEESANAAHEYEGGVVFKITMGQLKGIASVNENMDAVFDSSEDSTPGEKADALSVSLEGLDHTFKHIKDQGRWPVFAPDAVQWLDALHAASGTYPQW
jgi:hypothetical protein